MVRGRSFSVGLVCAVSVVLFLPQRLSAAPLFKSAQSYGSGGSPARSVAVADINGDGKLDIIVANGCTGCGSGPAFGVAVLLGTGDGGFGTAQNYSLNNQAAVSVAVGDVNGDGKQDLLVTTDCFSTTRCNIGGVWALLGEGNGKFQRPVVYNSGGIGASGIAVNDFNNDGKLDLAVANCAAIGSANCFTGIGTLAVLLGKGDGTFQAAKTFAAGVMRAWEIALGDVNGDDKIDVVITAPSVVGVLLGNGDGTFQPAASYNSGGGATGGLALADLNADGNLDVVVANGKVAVLLGNGDGTFQAAIVYDTGGSGGDAVAVADVNRDGNADLLVANYLCGSTYSCSHGSIGVLLGNGDGTFQHAVTYGSGGYGAFRLAIADLNGDFKPDVVVANIFSTGGDSSTGIIGVLFGTVGFQTSTNLRSDLNPSVYGQAILFIATVTSTSPTVLTGQVAFRWTQDGRTFEIGRTALNSGVATLSKSKLNTDLYPLSAIYLGDITHQRSASPIVNQVVNQTISFAHINSSQNPSGVGQPVTFTSQITSPTVKPSGPVTFFAGKAVLGTAQLNWAAKATFTTSTLPMGSIVIKVVYNGNSNIKGSSASITQTVQP